MATCGVLFVLFSAWLWIWPEISSYLADIRFARFISASKRRLRQLNGQHQSPDQNILEFRPRYLLTVVEGREKRTIEKYCKGQGIGANEFLARLAVDDARSGPKTLWYDELLLALGPLPKPRRPRAIEEVSKERAVRTEVMPSLIDGTQETQEQKLKEWEALYFPLSWRQYDLVNRHVELSRLTVRYHGRLALATIEKERGARRTTAT